MKVLCSLLGHREGLTVYREERMIDKDIWIYSISTRKVCSRCWTDWEEHLVYEGSNDPIGDLPGVRFTNDGDLVYTETRLPVTDIQDMNNPKGVDLTKGDSP